LAERRERTTGAPPAGASSGADGADGAAEALANLNDHLGRFLQHADTLLDEWSKHGAALRESVQGEIARLDDAIGSAVDDAGDRAGKQVGPRVEAAIAEAVERGIERGVRESMARLKAEVELLSRSVKDSNAAVKIGRSAGGDDRPRPLFWAALLAANVMLAALLVLGVKNCNDRAAPAQLPAAAVDAGAAPPSVTPDAAAAVVPPVDAAPVEIDAAPPPPIDAAPAKPPKKGKNK
jgi:hypothetical protein